MYKVSRETYEKVYTACQGMCVLCGKKVGLHLHHICSRGKDLTDNYRNCVMLCEDCHLNKVHGNLKKYRPILLEISEKIYGRGILDLPK